MIYHILKKRSSFQRNEIAENTSSIHLSMYQKLTLIGSLCAMAPLSVQAVDLIDEDFSTGAANFSVVAGGTWTTSAGRYILTNPSSVGAAQGLLGNLSVHQTVLTPDYTVSGIVHLAGTGSVYDDAALVFDYQNASNYYYVCLTETNKTTALGLMRILNGTHSELQDFPSLAITSGTDYTIEVIRSGTSIVVNINSVQVASVTDSSFAGGQVGVGSQNDPCQFDELLVSVNMGSGGGSGSITIEEDFNTSASNFNQVAGGTWSVSSGRYHLTNPSSTGAAQGLLGNISAHQTSLSGDYTVSGIIQLVGTGSAYDDGALVFDYQNPSNYYYVSLTETNKITALGLMKILNGSHSELQDFSSLSIASGVDYLVEVERSGSSITVFVNSVQVASITDSTFSGGQVGFGSQNDACHFDDLVVSGETGSGGGGTGEQLFNLYDQPHPTFQHGNGLDWPTNVGDASICLWSDDKMAAYSITVDDNTPQDHAWWASMANLYNLRITWFIITEGMDVDTTKGTWNGFQDIVDAGHSVQSHTVVHGTNVVTDQDYIDEYELSRDDINANITGQSALTLAYPNGIGRPDIAKNYYIGARGTSGTPNRANNIPYMETKSVTNGLTSDYINSVAFGTSGIGWLDNNAIIRGWLSTHYHFVQNKTAVEQMLNYVDSLDDLLWPALFEEVLLFTQERDTAILTVNSVQSNQIKFDLTDRMDDTIYTFPLTIKIRISNSWSSFTATQSGQNLESWIVMHQGNKYALVKAIPDQGEVTINGN